MISVKVAGKDHDKNDRHRKPENPQVKLTGIFQ